MKKIIFVLAFSLCNFLFAQEIIPVEEGKEVVAFSVIEEVPVYDGCETKKGNKALKSCMENSIRKLVAKKFNGDLGNDLGLPEGFASIMVAFKIDENGEIIDVKARAPHEKLKEEGLRVVNLIPKFKKPGLQKGKPVKVSYTLPIKFYIIGEPKTKEDSLEENGKQKE
ncbi:energy transducer TonB [uncultured Lacinutrix sp.]|uniref:energy transducer TonB n=1 Tax=uncultured Lacinutrix sp. TaxID=574032 RepID=UPI00260A621E|nr:energy transducer TonB [uncultured Lacinutrix sp.]